MTETVEDASSGSPMTIATAAVLLESQEWTFAKTMPQIPHWYALRRSWRGDTEGFLRVVRCIRDHGLPERFGRRTYVYLTVNGWKYWTMDASIEDTELINRARVEASPAETFHKSAT